jgi:stage II sporulation SpoM-like protein
MDPSRLALVQGIDDTRRTLRAWNDRPWPVVRGWVLGALAVAVVLLAGVWVVAAMTTPDPLGLAIPGLNRSAGLEDMGHVVLRNCLVLALHALACVAGFIAGSAVPLQAEQHRGWRRTLHEYAGPAAMGFVVGATLFSLCTQAYVLGGSASTLAAQLGVPIPMLLLTLLPHAVPELVALFLPLAAWTIASRRQAWHELLAATVATVALALPVLVVTAAIEVFVWPQLMSAASPL